ncbi:CinA family protein [Candidatus Pantoea persica]|uniref:CinA family protein n=1 Tax=Candidatus Pantoea persica TaxID=2518128 RepID=UPI00215DA01F|nr:CinA family protein [Candidatus Pantoea persica]MBA2816274.1 putative Nicotinamide-nucleotide amidohydrolase PncC [Candidatus Pantoea persica]
MNDALNHAAGQLGQRLLSSEWRLVTAESCTAGLISMTLTAVENSGNFYTSGFVTYSDNAKSQLLGVRPETFEAHTAVSEQTAREVSLSITGYAGPDSGEDGTPAGTIWFGWALPDGSIVAEMRHFEGDPKSVMEQGAQFALARLDVLLRDVALHQHA